MKKFCPGWKYPYDQANSGEHKSVDWAVEKIEKVNLTFDLHVNVKTSTAQGHFQHLVAAAGVMVNKLD